MLMPYTKLSFFGFLPLQNSKQTINVITNNTKVNAKIAIFTESRFIFGVGITVG